MRWRRNLRTEALLLLVLPIVCGQSSPAKDDLILSSSPPEAVALARFFANQKNVSRPEVEIIEIEASLPRLNKSGRLRAIRRILPAESHIMRCFNPVATRS